MQPIAPAQPTPAAQPAPVPLAAPAKAPAGNTAAPAAAAAKPDSAAAAPGATKSKPAAAGATKTANGGTKQAPKTPRVVTPKPQPAVKMGPSLTKAEVFSRAAPATMILIAVQDNRWSSSLGVVVSPQGAVVSDSRLLSGVEKGQVHGFAFDPSLSGDEDPIIFLRAHKEQAIPLHVVRIDPENHLLMLQLPELPPKKSYAYLDTADTQGVTVGLDVVVLRTRGRQTLAMMTGSLAARRPDLLEVEPALPLDTAGGPVLTQSGRLIGLVTFSDKAVLAAGQARPVEVIRELLAGKRGGEPAPSSVPAVMEAPPESRNAVEAVRIGFGAALAQKMDKKPALIVQGEFISAMAKRGRAVVHDIESVDVLNGIIKGMVKGSDPKTKVVSELFPLLITDRKGTVFWRVGINYRPVPGSNGGSPIAAIDDVTGALYATDSRHQLIYYDDVNQSWRISPLSQLAALQASGGTLFAMLHDNRLIAADKDGKNTRQLFPRLLKSAKLESSQGILYVISDDGSVYRYRNKKWDQKGQPIAFAMQKLVVQGESWYGLDGAGRIFCSTVQRYIDRDGNTAGLYGIGMDLLVLTKENTRFYYSLEHDAWGPWSHW